MAKTEGHNLINVELKNWLEQAGSLALELQANLKVSKKPDETAVTNADIAVSDFLTGKLSSTAPVLSEESKVTKEILSAQQFWVLDPIDGTVSYSKKQYGWSILLAKCELGQPVEAWIYFPSEARMYWAKKDSGAFRVDQNILQPCGPASKTNTLILSPGTEAPEPMVDHFSETIFEYGGANKIMKVALGEADFYPSILKKYGVWDLCAPSLFIVEAGGQFRYQDKGSFEFSSPISDRTFFCAHSSIDLEEMSKMVE